jgi:hypothetical protein
VSTGHRERLPLMLGIAAAAAAAVAVVAWRPWAAAANPPEGAGQPAGGVSVNEASRPGPAPTKPAAAPASTEPAAAPAPTEPAAAPASTEPAPGPASTKAAKGSRSQPGAAPPSSPPPAQTAPPGAAKGGASLDNVDEARVQKRLAKLGWKTTLTAHDSFPYCEHTRLVVEKDKESVDVFLLDCLSAAHAASELARLRRGIPNAWFTIDEARLVMVQAAEEERSHQLSDALLQP